MSELTTTTSAERSDDDQYQAYERALREGFAAATADSPSLFTTDAEALFATFLAALPADRRQHYTCNACRRFIETYGGLVAVLPDGARVSPLWGAGVDAPPFFAPAAKVLARVVARAKITGVFISSETTWGTPETTTPKPPGAWRHLHVIPTPRMVYARTPLLNASQRAAERREEHGMLCRGLAEFPLELVQQAHTLLTSGNLYRSEKCIGVAKWLLDLHQARAAAKGAAVDAVTWLAVACAPAGFCHVRSGMIGTLLEDIQAGLAFADIKAKFDAKMHPLSYQRAQAAASAGNIAQAERIVSELASAGALERRFARVEDLETLWKPKPAPAADAPGGVFGHLKTKAPAPARELAVPPTVITWEKFAHTVLPDAARVEFHVPAANRTYSALVTAANADAPPIIQWDRLEDRNPVTWYVYHGGSSPSDWALAPGWCDVTAIALQPSMWGGPAVHTHQGRAAFLILDGARDMKRQRGERGGGLFVELLRSEYHAVRATMEAYAKDAVIAEWDESTACGLKIEAGHATAWNYVVRVTAKDGSRVSYNLDRWD